MSLALPQEVQTRKLNSLPDDLKSIADELIAKKFGIEEEVVEKTDRFRREYPSRPMGYRSSQDENESNVGYGRGLVREYNPFTRSDIYRSYIQGHSLDAVHDAMNELDRNALPGRGRTLYIHPDTLRNIMMHPAMAGYKPGMNLTLWGMNIKKASYGNEYIEIQIVY